MTITSARSTKTLAACVAVSASMLTACGSEQDHSEQSHQHATLKAQSAAQVLDGNRIKALDNHHEHEQQASRSEQLATQVSRVQNPGPPLYADHFDGAYRVLSKSQRTQSATRSANATATIVGGTPSTHHGNECVMDFKTPNLVQYFPGGATHWADRSYLPWVRDCGQNSRLDMRQSKYGHLHFGFEDPNLAFCTTDPDYSPAHVDEDGNCELIDINTVERSYATSHGWDEVMQLRANYKYSSDWVPFDLKRIRIVREQGARVCYRKADEPNSDGPWIIADGHGTGTSSDTAGGWYCWPHLGQGTWDLAGWADNVNRVKITGSARTPATFAIDDIVARIH